MEWNENEKNYKWNEMWKCSRDPSFSRVYDFLNFIVAGSEPIINVDDATGVDGLGLTI